MRPAGESEHILRLVRDGLPDRDIAEIVDAPVTRVQTIRLRSRILKQVVAKPRGVSQPPEPAPPKDRPNPVAVAVLWLGPRLREVPGKGFFLDGMPASTGEVVKAANRVRVERGQSQVGPLHWRV